MHGKAYADNHAQRLDSDQHAKACNRAQKSAYWLAIDCWKLIFALASAEKVPFLITNLQLLDTCRKPSCCMGYCAAETYPMILFISP